MARFSLRIGAAARVSDGIVEYKHVGFVSGGGLLKRTPASVEVSVYKGFKLPFDPLALCRKSHLFSTINWTFFQCKG